MILYIKGICLRVAWMVVAVLAVVPAIAQSCSINAPADVCLGSVTNFSVTANPTPVSYSWDFGDGNSSAQASPSYLYTAAANRQVKVILTLTGGQTCTATHNMVVHPKPVADFSIDNNSIFCFSKNQVCITDNSTPGPTGNPLNKRVFLWDDGAGDNTNNPSAQKTICHTYQFTGTYALVMEITDDKGCQSKMTKNIDIKPDYKVSFFTTLVINPVNCKWQVCFDNETQPADTGYDSYEWDFGDGKKSVSKGDYPAVCHDYDSNGSYTAKLVVHHKSGCVDSAKTTVNIAKPDINFNLQMKRSYCLGDTVRMLNNASNPGAFFRWFVKDSASGFEQPLPHQTNPVSFIPSKPGKYYIKLNIYRDSCQQNGFDSIEVKCPAANILAKNEKLCAEGDTTYFCDASCYYKSYHSKLLWDFGHGNACTTDISKGQNVNGNCRYSVDKNPKHLYTFNDIDKKTSCYNATLTVSDTVTGCVSQAGKQVLMGLPGFESLIVDHNAKQYCQDLGGIDADRVVNFYISGLKCNGWDMFLNFDSAYDKYNFLKVTPNPPPQKTYKSTADPEGYLTIGFAVQNGNTQKFSSCTTLSADSGKTCADTIWYHRKFDMAPIPNPYVGFWESRGCAPFNFTLKLDDTVQYGLSKAIWDWGDGNVDSIEYNPGDSIIPVRHHTYWKNGLYTPSITLVNRRGCGESHFLTIGLGYFNYVDYDSLVCAGDSVQLTEFLSYYDKPDTFWLDTNRALAGKEKVWWDFDDGNGFIVKPPKKKWVFPAEGTYKVRMASVDSAGCPDTFSFTVKAAKADANIKFMPDTFYCNDNILRFYDSSFGSPEIPGDVVAQWTWAFGDGKNNSFLKDPFHYYSSFGKKTISLAVKSKAGCLDTAYKDIMIVGPEPDFEIISDSVGCDPLVVTFDNTSGRVKNWIWYMGDPANTIISTNKDTGITFTYSPPGTYYVKMYGSDSIYNPQTGNTYFCSAFYPDTPMVKKVVVLPYFPMGIDLPDTICQGNPATFTSVSDPRYDFFRWWMGNGDSVFTNSPAARYTYNTPGNYRVDFKPTYTPTPWERLCVLDTFEDITVIPISAEFDIHPNSAEPLFYFVNQSKNAVRYHWDFGHPQSGGKNTSGETNPSHNYQLDKGTYTVCLIAYNKEDCPDTFCRQITSNYTSWLFIPNVFTPGKDSSNNRFDIDIFVAGYYQLDIFNRWGEKVFEGNADGNGINDPVNWDGLHYKTGELCPDGVYYVVFDYEILGEDKRKRYTGTVTLFREK